MDLRTHDTSDSFLGDAGAHLAAREVEHSLLLALAHRVASQTSEPERAPYLATIHDGDRVVGAALRTPPHNVVLSHIAMADREQAIERIVEDLRARGTTLPGVTGPVDVAAHFAASWSRACGTSARELKRHREMALERVTTPTPVTGELRVATQSEVDLLAVWASAFIDETGLPEADRVSAQRESLSRRAQAGTLYLWNVDATPVSMASASGTPRVPRIGLVYTPPDARKRGYASACVAALSQQMLDGGAWRVALNTDVDNPTSNKIYEAIGYVHVGDGAMYEFG